MKIMEPLILADNYANKLYSYANDPKEIHIIKEGDHLFSSDEVLNEVKNIVKEWFKKTL